VSTLVAVVAFYALLTFDHTFIIAAQAKQNMPSEAMNSALFTGFFEAIRPQSLKREEVTTDK
jgi:hypothetical protein